MTSPSEAAGKSLLLIHSHYGEPPGLFRLAEERGDALVVRELQLRPEHFAQARGLVTTTHLDQIGFMAYGAELQALLARGGRWFFNGHILRELVPGLGIYRPIPNVKRPDLALTRLVEHPIFAGIDQKGLEENKGVAGFYGRGHNPLPAGAVAVNGIGPNLLPIDWEWMLPGGGRIFSHAGNDLAGMGNATGDNAILADRIIAWTRGEL